MPALLCVMAMCVALLPAVGQDAPAQRFVTMAATAVGRDGVTERRTARSAVKRDTVSTNAQVGSEPLEADALFKAGKFQEAEAAYHAVLTGATEAHAAARLGMLALFRNDLDAAERWLMRALNRKPDDRAARRELARVHYRRDDFTRAAEVFRTLGMEAMAKKLESFKGAAPYQIEGDVDESRLAFLHTDPLPLIQVKVNGSEAVNFLIDTGASEIYLDTEFARTIGAGSFGSTTGVYGGGQQAETEHGRVDSLTLGDFTIRNVPVHILPTRRFSAAAQGKKVDGILGTALLSHFLSTLDYPAGELILRRTNQARLAMLERQVNDRGGAIIPFWLAGDHYMVAWGRVNSSPPVLLFVDTGLAGAGFVGPESTLKEAAIQLPAGPTSQGLGGGGAMKTQAFIVDDLSLGPISQRTVRAFFGPFPPSLEYSQGFRIAGIISHQFFRPFAVTFDFVGMRLLLRKSA
jgi:hypothetical protein